MTPRCCELAGLPELAVVLDGDVPVGRERVTVDRKRTDLESVASERVGPAGARRGVRAEGVEVAELRDVEAAAPDLDRPAPSRALYSSAGSSWNWSSAEVRTPSFTPSLDGGTTQHEG